MDRDRYVLFRCTPFRSLLLLFFVFLLCCFHFKSLCFFVFMVLQYIVLYLKYTLTKHLISLLK